MRFNEETMSAFHYYIPAIITSIIVATAGAYETGLQFETNGGFVLQHSSAQLEPEQYFGGAMNTTINAARRLSPFFSLFFGEQQRLAGKDINNWQIAPNYNTLLAGGQWEGPGIVTLSAASTQYPFPESYTPSFMPSFENLSPQWLNRGTIHWTAGNNNPVEFDGDLSYFNYQYELSQKNPDPLTPEFIEGRYGTQADNDLWGSLSLRGNLPADLYLQLVSRFKSDMEASSVYDLHNHTVSFGGFHGNRRSRVMVDWYLRERFVKSAAMFYNGYHDGFSTEAGIRPVLKLKTGIYLKGNAQFVIGDNIYRQYLELAFRRWWKSGTTIDLTWWNSWGGLFPRQCGDLRTTVYVTEEFGFTPSFSLYFGDIPAKGIYRFYRTDSGLELFLHFDGRTLLRFGGTYAHFDHHPHFGSGWQFYAGLRRW